MKLKGIKHAIAVLRKYNDFIIYYNSRKGELFVTKRRIIYPYDNLYCITQMMSDQGYRFDRTVKGLKAFMSANEYHFNNKEGGE